MPNQPAENTVTASFTMPADLLEKVRAKAKREMTNQSDIMRRALMNYLSPEERAMVLAEIANSQKVDAVVQTVAKQVKYKIHRKRPSGGES